MKIQKIVTLTIMTVLMTTMKTLVNTSPVHLHKPL